MRVIAIDPGTSCGYAWTDTGKPRVEHSGTWDLSPKRFEGGGMRYLRVRQSLRFMLDTRGERVVFYEEVAAHKGTAAAHIYGGIVGAIQALCEEKGVPYQGVPVGTIKKRATGRGNANKAAMIEAACKEFGPVEDDNQADALWLLVVALEELGEGES